MNMIELQTMDRIRRQNERIDFLNELDEIINRELPNVIPGDPAAEAEQFLGFPVGFCQ
jgi:hypothetical protein